MDKDRLTLLLLRQDPRDLTLAMAAAKAERIIYEMQSGDYENLLNVFDREFGDFVILER